jgi:hypothetical protein
MICLLLVFKLNQRPSEVGRYEKIPDRFFSSNIKISKPGPKTLPLLMTSDYGA